jgi:hypothetical protein
MIRSKVCIIFFLCSTWLLPAAAQKQLILLKGESVVLRLKPGDEFIYRLKNSKQVHTEYVNNLFDAAVMVHHDTIPFNQIDRIYFPHEKFYNKVGGAMVVGGAALFLIDQFNTIVVRGETPSLDARISTISLSMVAVGLPMMLIKKKSQKVNYKYHLMTVKKGSIFYQPDRFESNSPFYQN